MEGGGEWEENVPRSIEQIAEIGGCECRKSPTPRLGGASRVDLAGGVVVKRFLVGVIIRRAVNVLIGNTRVECQVGFVAVGDKALDGGCVLVLINLGNAIDCGLGPLARPIGGARLSVTPLTTRVPLAMGGGLLPNCVLAASILVLPERIDIRIVNLAAIVGASWPNARESTTDTSAVLGTARTDAILTAKPELRVARGAVVGTVVTRTELAALTPVAVLGTVVTPAVFAALGTGALVSTVPILGLAVGATLVPGATPRTVWPDAKPGGHSRRVNKCGRGQRMRGKK